MNRSRSEARAAAREGVEIHSITPGSGPASTPGSATSDLPRAPDEQVPDPDSPAFGDALQTLSTRLDRVERQNGWLKFLVLVLTLGATYTLYNEIFPDGVLIQKTMMESKELKITDADGNPRLFLRMYSRVPVLQLMDGNGRPRMSLGLRFDDTPFIDLSDQRGNTRATLEINQEDAAALRLYDENGEVSFKIN